MKTAKIFLTSLVILFILPLSIFFYSRYIEPNRLVVNHLELESEFIDESIKIVFFSDTHLGDFSLPNQLKRIVAKINAEDPDLVLFMGDLINYSLNPEIETSAISEALKSVKSPHGKYAVVGNHELALADQYDYTALMNQGGFDVLINDFLDVPELNVRLLGLDDDYLGEPDRNLPDSANKEAYNLLMTHEPDIVDELNLDQIQLVLAGHTHGGQVSIPFLKNQVLPSGGKNYLKGLYSLGDKKQTTLFVTKGIGMTKLPLRFMSVPEIVSISISPLLPNSDHELSP